MKPSKGRGRLLSRLVLALCILVPLFALRTHRAWNEACALLRRELPRATRVDVAIGRCEIDPLRRGLKVYELAVSAPGQAGPPLLAADSAEVRLGLTALLFRRLDLTMVHLAHPRIVVDATRLGPRPVERRPCPLDALERVTLGRLMVHDASLQVRLPGERALELDEVDLGWTARRGVMELELRARTGVFRQGGSRPDLLLGPLSAQASLDREAQALQVAAVDGSVDDITFDLSGKVDTLCDPDLELSAQAFVPLRALAKVVSLPEKPQGHVLARVTATGRQQSPVYSLELVGAGVAMGKLEPGDFTAKASLQGRELRVWDLNVPAGPQGAVHLSGTVGLRPGFPVRGLVRLERAELAKVLEKVGRKGARVDVLASGQIALSGTASPLQMEGGGELALDGFRLLSRPQEASREGRPALEISRGRVRGSLHVLPDRVELPDLEVVAGDRTRLLASGTLHYAREAGVSIKATADPLDLSDLGHLARFECGGSGTASFVVRGPYDDVRVESRLTLRDSSFWDYNPGVVQGELVYERRMLRFPSFSGQKGTTQYFGSGELDLVKERGGGLRLVLEIPRGRAEDVVDAIVRLHPAVELFQGELTGDARGQIELHGPAGRTSGKIDLWMDGLRYYGRALGQGRLSMRFVDGKVMELTEASLDGAAGKLSADGTFSFSGPLRYRFRGEDLSLPELVGEDRARQLGITGTMQLQGKVGGDRQVPLVEGYLTSPKVTFADRSLGGMKLDGRIQGRELQVWGRPFADASGTLRMTLRSPIPYDVSLQIALPEIRPLLPDGAISQGLSGELAGSARARGQVKNPGSAVVDALVDRISLSRGDFSGQNVSPVTLSYERGKLTVGSLVFQGPSTQLTAGGTVGPEEVDFKVQGAADMRLLSSFVPRLERAGGHVDLSAVASGPVASPAVLGSAHVRDARFSVRDLPIAVRSLSGTIEFSERQARIAELDGVLNDGRVSLAGYAELERFLPRRGGCTRQENRGPPREVPCINVQARLDEISVRPVEDLPFLTSGELELYGDPEALVLAGGLSIGKLRYARPLDLETFLKDVARARERLASSSSKDRKHEWLKLNVGVDLADVRVDNNLARARLLGKVTLTGTNARPGLVGTVEVAEGSQAFFRQNRFEVSELLIELKDRHSIDAVFDLHAQAQVREYLVRLHAFGRPNEPKVVLTSEPQLAEADVLSLLTLGVTSRDRSQSTGVETASYLAAEALFNASGLDREVQRFLPKDNEVVKDLSFHFTTTYNDVLHQMEPAAQIESRLLTEDLKLELTRPFSGRGTRARAEYRILDGVLVQGQWDNENSTARDLGNFGVDLKLRWEVK